MQIYGGMAALKIKREHPKHISINAKYIEQRFFNVENVAFDAEIENLVFDVENHVLDIGKSTLQMR